MRHWIEEETRRDAIHRFHLENVGSSFGRLRRADPCYRSVRGQQPHERQPCKLRLPCTALEFSDALVCLRRVGLSGVGVLRRIAAAIEAASTEPATAATIAAEAPSAANAAPR